MIFGIFGQIANAFAKGISKGLKRSTNRSSTASKMAHRQNWSKSLRTGSNAQEAFAAITQAHSDPDEIVSEFGLDEPDCIYVDPQLGMSPYEKAYSDALLDAMMISMITGEDPDELVDEDEVSEDAYDLAIDWADRMMSGTEWIDADFLDWAFYTVSDHNR